jgi:hypothetical protein
MQRIAPGAARHAVLAVGSELAIEIPLRKFGFDASFACPIQDRVECGVEG